jgi:hypothetical protein
MDKVSRYKEACVGNLHLLGLNMEKNESFGDKFRAELCELLKSILEPANTLDGTKFINDYIMKRKSEIAPEIDNPKINFLSLRSLKYSLF